MAAFMVAIPAASFISSPISTVLLQMNEFASLRGWHQLFIFEGIPTMLLGIACLQVLTNRPEEARWLLSEECQWPTNMLAGEAHGSKKVVQMPLFKLSCNRYVLYPALADVCVLATGSTPSVRQPRLLRSFGSIAMQTGLPNSVPYAMASVLMVVWGHRSDHLKERR